MSSTNEIVNPESTEKLEESVVEPTEPSPTFNPTLSDEESKKMKGDAIGATMYSERFVLSTLLALAKEDKTELAKDKEFEQQLCSLWDMTLEADVVNLLLEHDVLDVFAQCIQETQDRRLTEILVGIMGNMSSFIETRDQLLTKPEVIESIFLLAGCSDTLTLIQLMRLLAALVVPDEDKAKTIKLFEAFQTAEDFVPDFAFMLSNSINKMLLQAGLETLNAILTKFADITDGPSEEFSQAFLDEELIEGTIAAFNVLTQETAGAAQESNIGISKSTKKIVEIFLNIHCILTEHSADLHSFYLPQEIPLLDCFNLILQPLSQPTNLLPISRYGQLVLESIMAICAALDNIFHAGCLAQVIGIWQLITAEQQGSAVVAAPANDFESDDNNDEPWEVDMQVLSSSLLKFVCSTIVGISEDQLEPVLSQYDLKVIQQLRDATSAEKSTAKLKIVCERLEKLKEANASV